MRKPSSKESFLQKANKVHQNKYEYNSSIYVNSRTHIAITCLNHGNFLQTPANHIQGYGCPKCGNESTSKHKLSNTKEFLEKSKLIHNNKYDYSLVEYKNAKSKVTIICAKHGKFFQSPFTHLRGSGCRKCAAEFQRLSNDKFVKRSNLVHDNKYDYLKTHYTTSHTKVEILCKVCNHVFQQKPGDHLNGHGCPKCKFNNNSGFWSKSEWMKLCKSKNHDPLVYIIRCFNDVEEFIKIGITSRKLHDRFSGKRNMPYSYEVIKEIKGSADFVWDKEKDLHRKYKSFKHKPLIYFPGETECFNTSILNDLKFNR